MVSVPDSANNSSSSAVAMVTVLCKKFPKITPLASSVRAVVMLVNPRLRTNEIE